MYDSPSARLSSGECLSQVQHHIIGTRGWHLWTLAMRCPDRRPRERFTAMTGARADGYAQTALGALLLVAAVVAWAWVLS